MPFLRQSTSQVIRFGPCLDKTDGVTEETALTLAQADMRLSKDGGAFAQKSAAGNATHDSDGWYSTTLSTTDTATVGELRLNVHQSANMLPVWDRWWVIEEDIYDALFGAAAAAFDANQRMDLGSVLGTAQTAGDLAALVITVDTVVDAIKAITDALPDAGALTAIGTDTARLTAVRAAVLTDWINGGRLDLLLDAIPTTAMRGTDGANTTTPPTVGAIADQVWDEILTGATHNVVNSAGRRLRALQEFQGYALGAVWIDTVNGTAGTSDFENGTVNNPVLTLADAITLASSLNLKRFVVTPGSSITFAEAHVDELWVGTSWTLALGGQDCSKTTISGAAISGTATSPTGEIHLDECEVGTATLGQTHLRACTFDATVTLSAAATYLFENCSLGGTSCIIDLGAAIGNTHVDISRWSGSLELQNVGQTGTDAVDLDGAGALTINVNCVGGTIDIHGFWDITDNGSSTITRAGITDDVTLILGDTAGIAGSAMRGTDGANTVTPLTAAEVNAEVDKALDTAIPGSPTADSINERVAAIDDKLPSGNIGGVEGIVKNAALSDFEFLMIDSTDDVSPKTGLTVTGERSIDGGAFAGVSGTIAEVANGIYQFDALAADTNGDLITWRFTSAGANDRLVTFKTV